MHGLNGHAMESVKRLRHLFGKHPVKSNCYVTSTGQSDSFIYGVFPLIPNYSIDLGRYKRIIVSVEQIRHRKHRRPRLELAAEEFGEWKDL